MSRAGYVLVGGRSSRMGRDKALLPFRGMALAEFVANTVAAAAGNVVLVGDPKRYSDFRFPVIADRYPGQGPLGGILTALDHTAAAWNLIVACDMPEITAGFLMDLLGTAERIQADVLLPTGPSGRPEPLCAIYHRRCLKPIEAAFAAGERKITAAFAGLHTVSLPTGQSTLFQNVNTPEDWAGYAG